MHHFKIAMEMCPEVVYVRELRTSIVKTAVRAGKLDQLIELIRETYGVECV